MTLDLSRPLRYSWDGVTQETREIKLHLIGKTADGSLVVQEYDPTPKYRDWLGRTCHWGFPVLTNEDEVENIPEEETT